MVEVPPEAVNRKVLKTLGLRFCFAVFREGPVAAAATVRYH